MCQYFASLQFSGRSICHIEFHSAHHQVIVMMLLITLLLVTIALGYLANRIARLKGRDPWVWTILTVVLLFPILILLILPTARGNDSSLTRNA